MTKSFYTTGDLAFSNQTMAMCARMHGQTGTAQVDCSDTPLAKYLALDNVH